MNKNYGNKYDNYEPSTKELIDFKNEIGSKVNEEHLSLAKEWLPKIVEVLSQKWKYGSHYKRQQEIKNIIGNPHLQPNLFRKLIQIYREAPEKWNTKSIEGNFVPQYIIACAAGYKMTSNPKEIEQYLKSLDARRTSLNKQVLAAEIQIKECKEVNRLNAMSTKESVDEIIARVNKEVDGE